MRGIVVWCKADRQSAIIWCADSKKLAYLADSLGMSDEAEPLNVGDLVAIKFRENSVLRYCTEIKVLERGYFPELVRGITSISEKLAEVPTATVFPGLAPANDNCSAVMTKEACETAKV